MKGCCQSTIVVDALGSSSSLRKRISDGGTLPEVLEPIQTIPGQLSKVRVIDVKPCSEPLTSRLERDLGFVFRFRKLHDLPQTDAWTEYLKQRKLDPETSVENLVASTFADFTHTCLKEDSKT